MVQGKRCSRLVAEFERARQKVQGQVEERERLWWILLYSVVDVWMSSGCWS